MSEKKNKPLIIAGLIVLFLPMAYLGWLAVGGRLMGPGINQVDIGKPWVYFVWPGFIGLAVVYYYLLKEYYKVK